MPTINSNIKNENKRLDTLYSFNILDTPPDGTFDQIVKIVANVFDVPIALVSLVDVDRIWFKSAFGLEAQEIDKETGRGLCSSAILSNEFYMIEDAIKDPRTLNNILVNSEFGLRFYAAAPLTTSNGYNLGTLCVLDKKARKFTEEEQNNLSAFAKIVIEQMEMRIQTKNIVQEKIKLEYIIANELKNDLYYIPKLAQQIKKIKYEQKESESLLNTIEAAATKAFNTLENFVSTGNDISKTFEKDYETFELNSILEHTTEINSLHSARKNIEFELNFDAEINVSGHKQRLSEMLDCVIGNILTIASKKSKIIIELFVKEQTVSIQIHFTTNIETILDINKAFSVSGGFSKNNGGLGLWFAKEIVQLHLGHIAIIETKSKNKFIANINLPIIVDYKKRLLTN